MEFTKTKTDHVTKRVIINNNNTQNIPEHALVDDSLLSQEAELIASGSYKNKLQEDAQKFGFKLATYETSTLITPGVLSLFQTKIIYRGRVFIGSPQRKKIFSEQSAAKRAADFFLTNQRESISKADWVMGGGDGYNSSANDYANEERGGKEKEEEKNENQEEILAYYQTLCVEKDVKIAKLEKQLKRLKQSLLALAGDIESNPGPGWAYATGRMMANGVLNNFNSDRWALTRWIGQTLQVAAAADSPRCLCTKMLSVRGKIFVERYDTVAYVDFEGGTSQAMYVLVTDRLPTVLLTFASIITIITDLVVSGFNANNRTSPYVDATGAKWVIMHIGYVNAVNTVRRTASNNLNTLLYGTTVALPFEFDCDLEQNGFAPNSLLSVIVAGISNVYYNNTLPGVIYRSEVFLFADRILNSVYIPNDVLTRAATNQTLPYNVGVTGDVLTRAAPNQIVPYNVSITGDVAIKASINQTEPLEVEVTAISTTQMSPIWTGDLYSGTPVLQPGQTRRNDEGSRIVNHNQHSLLGNTTIQNADEDSSNIKLSPEERKAMQQYFENNKRLTEAYALQTSKDQHIELENQQPSRSETELEGKQLSETKAHNSRFKLQQKQTQVNQKEQKEEEREEKKKKETFEVTPDNDDVISMFGDDSSNYTVTTMTSFAENLIKLCPKQKFLGISPAERYIQTELIKIVGAINFELGIEKTNVMLHNYWDKLPIEEEELELDEASFTIAKSERPQLMEKVADNVVNITDTGTLSAEKIKLQTFVNNKKETSQYRQHKQDKQHFKQQGLDYTPGQTKDIQTGNYVEPDYVPDDKLNQIEKSYDETLDVASSQSFRRDSAQRKKTKTKEKELKKERAETVEYVTKATTRNHVLSRIASKYKSHEVGPSSYRAIFYLEKVLSKFNGLNAHFIYDLSIMLWGKDWRCDSLPQLSVSNALSVSEIKSQIYIWSLLNFLSNENRNHLLTTNFAEIYASKFQTTWSDDSKILGAEASAHNATMHALNGNTEAEVLTDLTAIKALGDKSGNGYETGKAEVKMQPWNFITMLDTLMRGNPPNQIDIDFKYMFAADVMQANNTILNSNQTVPTAVWFIPRQYRTGLTGTITTTQRLRVYHSTLSYTKGYELQSTELAKEIQDVASKVAMNWNRADSIMYNGYKALHIAPLSNATSTWGYEITTMLTKMMFYKQIDLYAKGPLINMVKIGAVMSGEPRSLFDRNASSITYARNNAFLPFGESCGGIQAVFPYSGLAGRLTFHSTTVTVADPNAIADALFCPINIFTNCSRPNAVLALLIACLAPFPSCMPSFYVSTTDRNGGNATLLHLFTHYAGALHIPGRFNIDVILPRKPNVVDPTNSVAANSGVILQPRSGPFATATILADTDFNVAFIGGAGPNIDLCEYLLTWSAAWEIQDYVDLLTILNNFSDLTTELSVAIETSWLWSIRYLNLVSSGGTPTSNVNATSLIYTDLKNAYHYPATETTLNFPVSDSFSAKFVMPYNDMTAINQVFMGVRSVVGKDPKLRIDAWCSKMLFDPFSAFYQLVCSRTFCAVMDIHMFRLGLTAEAWDGALTANNLNVAARETVLDHFIRISSTITVEPAPMNIPLQNLFAAITGKTLQVDRHGGACFSYAKYPRSGVANNPTFATITQDGSTTLMNLYLVPQLLSDLWRTISVKHQDLSICSFIYLNSSDTNTAVVEQGQVPRRIMIAGTVNLTPPFTQLESITSSSLGEMRFNSSETQWNSRLLRELEPACELTYADGSQLPITLGPNNWVMEPYVAPDPIIVTGATFMYRRNTTWIPQMDSNGFHINLSLDLGNYTLISRIMSGADRRLLPGWILGTIRSMPSMLLGPAISVNNSRWGAMVRKTDHKSSDDKDGLKVEAVVSSPDTIVLATTTV